jgi:hypothetical protein
VARINSEGVFRASEGFKSLGNSRMRVEKKKPLKGA